MKRVLIVAIIAVSLIVLAVLKLNSNKEKVQEKLYINDPSRQILVEVGKATNHTFEDAFSFLGTFEPYRQSIVGSDASGKVIKLEVEEGDKISQGKLIAKVDDEMLQLQLQNAEINIEGQKNDDNRYSNLAKENAIAGVQVEKTKMALKMAEVQRKQIQKQLKSTNLVAPYSGVVTKKMIDLGSVIGPGTPVIELTDISSVKLTIAVPERDILKFKVGQNVNVFVDVLGNQSFSGKVSNVNIVADRAHNFKVQITVKNPSSSPIMAGMYGSVKLGNSKSITALSIPRKALVGSTKDPKVYKVINGKAVLTPFTAGTSDGEFIEVVNGIKTTDRFVTKGQINLQNNAPVRVK